MKNFAIWRFNTIKTFTVRELAIRQNLIGRIVSGQKHLSHDVSQAVTLATDTVFLLSKHSVWEVVNDPMPHQQYTSQVLELQDAIIESFYQHYGHQFNRQIVCSYAELPIDKPLTEAFERVAVCFDKQQTISDTIAQHRLLELMLLLAERGHIFALPNDMATSDKIRQMVGNKLHMPWRRAEIAERLNMSESTLQRQLSDESTSFSALLKQIRMEYALFLLMEGKDSISVIADRCGYHSHSRFSEMFNAYYGQSPSQFTK